MRVEVEARVVVQVGLAPLAELGHVALKDRLHRWFEDLAAVGCDRDPHAEAVGD